LKIGAWDVSSVVYMNGLFRDAPAFNQDISNWNVSSATDMNKMFEGASAFDQNVGSWDVSSVTNMFNMFTYISLSTANYDALLNGWSALTL